MSLGGLGREIDWALKRWLSVSAPPMQRNLGDLDALRRSLPVEAQARLAELGERYDLATAANHSTRWGLWESAYLLDLCDRCFPRPPEGPALDIGARNWAYLPALALWHPHSWLGVELDAHRRYLNLATRAAYARATARHYPGCDFRAGSLLEVRGQFQLITWFLPFVRLGSLRAWGLPDRFFDPGALLAHAYGLLAPGGRMILCNQDASEAAIQKDLFAALDLPARALGPLGSVLSPFKRTRYGWCLERPGE